MFGHSEIELSRNTLYADHKDILHDLYRLQRRRHRAPNPAQQVVQRLRQENERLKHRLDEAETIVEFQKKVAALLGRPLGTTDREPQL